MSNELRPHHALCLQFFEGKGYSEGFTGYMDCFSRSLQDNTHLSIAEGEDLLCAHCPNRGSGCPGAARYDQAVKELCGLRSGQSISWAELTRRVRQEILLPGRLKEVCGDCEWFSICGMR